MEVAYKKKHFRGGSIKTCSQIVSDALVGSDIPTYLYDHIYKFSDNCARHYKFSLNAVNEKPETTNVENLAQ